MPRVRPTSRYGQRRACRWVLHSCWELTTERRKYARPCPAPQWLMGYGVCVHPRPPSCDHVRRGVLWLWMVDAWPPAKLLGATRRRAREARAAALGLARRSLGLVWPAPRACVAMKDGSVCTRQAWRKPEMVVGGGEGFSFV